MSASHSFVVHNALCLIIFLLFAALLCLALFGYSAYLLKFGSPSSGNCPSTACLVGAASQTCVAVPGGVADCSDLCVNSRAAEYAPFRFDAGLGPVTCTFPANNSNWRLPTTFFSFVFAVLAVVCRVLRWRGITLVCSLLFMAGSGLSFYVMIIDAMAVVKGYKQCANGFGDLGSALTGLTLQCDRYWFGSVVVVDAFIGVTLMYLAAVLVGVFKALGGASSAGGAAGGKAKGGSAAAGGAGGGKDKGKGSGSGGSAADGPSAEEKRKMFMPQDGDEEEEKPRLPFT